VQSGLTDYIKASSLVAKLLFVDVVVQRALKKGRRC
jgi:hypothetical protein